MTVSKRDSMQFQPPQAYLMTVVARDPSVLDPAAKHAKRRILRTRIRVPASRLEPGPRGPRFHVVSFDASERRLQHPPANLAGATGPDAGWNYRDRFLEADDEQLIRDHRFHAQNVYAIAARTLGLFEAALGRPVPWSFGRAQLYLVPTAFMEPNAFYSDTDQALLFGYFEPRAKGKKSRVLTCLAHDIVAHETTHAVLDGLRRRFDVPGLPDQAGFHEGLADIVALLSILSSSTAIEPLIGRVGQPRVNASELSVEALRESVLFTIGTQLGQALTERQSGVRRSATLPPTDAWKNVDDPFWGEPHRRGEVLAAAVLQTLLHMWTRRLGPISGRGTVDRQRAAEEGAVAARHLLNMVIRAIDYCPPVDFELADFVEAIATSEAEIDPDDERGYQDALRTGFRSFGLEPDSRENWTPAGAATPSYRHFSYSALRSDAEETFRFMWDNAGYLGIDPRFQMRVENVRPAVRPGQRGFTVSETVLDYVQELVLERADLVRIVARSAPHLRPMVPDPSLVPDGTRIKLWGGGSIIFDEFGAVKHHRQKRLDDWERQLRRLTYLARRGTWDTRGQLGFSAGVPLGQRFVDSHEPSGPIEETW